MAETFPAIHIGAPGDLSTLGVKDLPFQELKEGELLVHMEYSTINPSDFGLVLGHYPVETFTGRLGFEGSGTVVKSGGGAEADALLGKRVAVVEMGAWGEYLVVKHYSAFPLLDETTFEQAASLVINPMTVAYFVELIQKSHKAAVNNAAASTLGQMLVKWCKILNIPLVNLVRRQEQVDILKSIGAEHVFNTSEEGWKPQAKGLCSSLGVTVGFDAIGGAATIDIADLIDDGGVVYNYGVLSGPIIHIGAYHLIFQRKRVEGLYLLLWLMSKSPVDRLEVGYSVQRLMREVFEIKHKSTINMSQLRDAILSYSESNSTNTKILVRTRVE